MGKARIQEQYNGPIKIAIILKPFKTRTQIWRYHPLNAGDQSFGYILKVTEVKVTVICD